MATLRIGERGIGQREEGGRLGRRVKEIRESTEEGERAYSEEERARKSTRSTVEKGGEAKAPSILWKHCLVSHPHAARSGPVRASAMVCWDISRE